MSTPTETEIHAALAWTDDTFTAAQRELLLALVSEHPDIDNVSEMAGWIIAAALRDVLFRKPTQK